MRWGDDEKGDEWEQENKEGKDQDKEDEWEEEEVEWEGDDGVGGRGGKGECLWIRIDGVRSTLVSIDCRVLDAISADHVE